jgi:hypothetical protein
MVRESQQWVPLTVPIPPLKARDRVIVRVFPGPSNNYSYDGCNMTSGILATDDPLASQSEDADAD